MTEPTLQGIAQSLDAYRAETQTSIDALRDTVMGLATHVDESIAASEQRMTGAIDTQIGASEQRMMSAIAASEHRVMDYIDRKVDGSDANVVAEIHKTDDKVQRLVDTLERKDVLTPREAQKVVLGQ